MSRNCRTVPYTPAAGGAGGYKGSKYWDVIFTEQDEIDSESDLDPSPSLTAVAKPTAPTAAELLSAFCSSPLMAALADGTTLWGDLLEAVEPTVSRFQIPDARSIQAATVASWDAQEEAFWVQPFAQPLEQRPGDWMDFSACSDEEWSAAMTWLYAHGWAIEAETRNSVRAFPADEPPRVWIPPSAAAANAPVVNRIPVSRTAKPAVYRPIFCAGGEKCKEGCPYEHGNTIKVLNQQCQFGATCSKRTVGVGATPCCRLHPDETWSADLVRHRP